MENPFPTPELTAEQQQALDAGDGIVSGPSFVLMRTDVVLDWFGFSPAELRRRLQPGLDQIEQGEGAEWNLREFLSKMHNRQRAKPE